MQAESFGGNFKSSGSNRKRLWVARISMNKAEEKANTVGNRGCASLLDDESSTQMQHNAETVPSEIVQRTLCKAASL